MKFGVNTGVHGTAFSSANLPPGYEKYKMAGASVHCLEGSFGLIINQSIPSDTWRISLHHFFFNQYTWIQYPANENYPLVLFNYGSDLRLYTYIGPDKPVKIGGNKFLPKKGLSVVDGDYTRLPSACEKGNYRFFTVAGQQHQIRVIVQNPLLCDSIFPELIKMLSGIGDRSL